MHAVGLPTIGLTTLRRQGDRDSLTQLGDCMDKDETTNALGINANPKSGLWRMELLVAAVAVACFVGSLWNDYCFDDALIVQHNPRVNDAGQFAAIWTTDHWSATPNASPDRDLLYRPVSLTSYRLIRILLGASPFPQHLANLILHAWISLLVMRLCRRFSGSDRAAVIAGLIFAALPINTEAVVAVVGRADLLATWATLIALIAHFQSMQPVASGKRNLWRVASALAAFVAMGSKENGVTVAPLVILLDAYWSGRTSTKASSRRWWTWQTVSRLAYLIVPCAAYLLLRYNALGGALHQSTPATKTINVLVDAPAWQHALGVVQLWGMYWAKTFWPDVLSIKYSINSIRLATGPLNGHVLLGVLIATGMLIGSIFTWRRGDRRIALLFAAILIAYAPTANALILLQVFFAERIWYLPSVWIAILLGLWIAPHIQRPQRWALLGLIIFGMAARGFIRTSEWRTNGTLFAAAYRDQPNGVGPLQLYGDWLTQHGWVERGIPLLSKAIEIDLGFTDAYRSRGQAYLLAGRLEEAVHDLQIAQSLAPGDNRTKKLLAQASDSFSRQDGSLVDLEKRAELDPTNVASEVALVRRLREMGRLDDALNRLDQRSGGSIWTANADWQNEYAITLTMLNQRDQAIQRYRASLAIEKDNPQREIELAMLLLERRTGDDLDQAWTHAAHAATLAPEAPTVLACQAELMALRGDLAEALEFYDRAIKRAQPQSRQRRLLEQRARALGWRP